ncbi:glycosyltransferase family 1 protein [Nocardiopsis sp. CNR-923]|uniref:glycosyltransferase family 1 protein n=1 Tax=Nocardiopsis sp. CNR-923 TaxID=1904965 RepID=UPI0021CCCF43|nr:glycosyltransferase family 1 protein [Nocardiopsis sp. CNR-923]
MLVEPATEHAGHWQDALVHLAAAATGEGHQAVVVTLNGLPAHIHGILREHGAFVLTRPGGSAGRLLLSFGKTAHRVAAIARRLLPHRRSPHQITLVARCLIEAASLRTSRHLLGSVPGVVVILTASEALHGMAYLLSRTPHLRVVHEVNTTEDRPLRALGYLAPPMQVVAVCPTRAVEGEVRERFPELRTTTHPFALATPQERITDDERVQARRALGIPDTVPVLCLVGGWWPHKDMTTTVAALERLTQPLHVLVAGEHTDPNLLHRIAAAPQVTLRTLPGPLTSADIRQVYAASSFTAVLRHPGVGKESGLVADCARLGVPLLVSDHDPDLTRRVSAWATVLPPRDPVALADALVQAATHPPPTPSPSAAEDLGLRTPRQMLALLKELMP